MPRLLLTTLVASFIALTACSGLKTLNFITPYNGYTLHSDIVYQQDSNKKLDVYLPNKPDERQTVLVFFYGGSWQTGSKNLYRFVGQSLAKQGFVTIIADYRTYPQAYFPAFMEDAANVLKWTYNNIKTYGGNNQRIFVAGHSAGAHIALLLTLDTSYLEKINAKPEWIHGAIGIAGPYDFLPFTDPKIKDLFSKVPDDTTQPLTFIRKNVPPVLLLHGLNDTDVHPENSIMLAKKLHAHKNTAVLLTYKDVNHTDIILAMSNYFTFKASVLKDINNFIKDN